MDSKKKYVFEIREIDGWMYDDNWIWNTSYFIGHMKTSAKDEKRAFARYLNKHGIYFKKNRTIIDVQDGGSILEVQDRKTKEPLYVAIYSEHLTETEG